MFKRYKIRNNSGNDNSIPISIPNAEVPQSGADPGTTGYIDPTTSVLINEPLNPPPSITEPLLNAMSDNANALPDEPTKRQRMKPGQRREQILQTLASMLEQPGTERITTALLAS